MIISEDDIRNRSRTLFEAFADLAGHDMALSVSDFIALRTEAVAEISAGIGNGRGAAHVTAKPAHTDSRPEQAPKTAPAAAVVNTPAAIQAGPKDNEDDEIVSIPDTEQLSAFELLRRASDPWND